MLLYLEYLKVLLGHGAGLFYSIFHPAVHVSTDLLPLILVPAFSNHQHPLRFGSKEGRI